MPDTRTSAEPTEKDWDKAFEKVMKEVVGHRIVGPGKVKPITFEDRVRELGREAGNIALRMRIKQQGARNEE